MTLILVYGEPNFETKHTGLTAGGLIQPSVAWNMIETQGNVEKELCQRFLLRIPQPLSIFEDLRRYIDKEFTATMGRYHLKMILHKELASLFELYVLMMVSFSWH